jgi:uncharacterized protein YdaU (DUF1376 family)
MADEPFDAKRARSKRPMPLWVDALVRDTALLSTDEFGAYMKILTTMWSARDAALPNDPHKLARAAGVSLRLWNSRIGPALSGFWMECPEGITQKRLREEAEFTEEHCQMQSDKKREADEKRGACAKPTGDNNQPRKKPQKKDKPLKTCDVKSTTVTTAAKPQIQPTQLPNYPTVDEEGLDKSNPPPSTARERALVEVGFLEEIAWAAGYPTANDPPDRWLDDEAQALVESWRDMGLSEARIIAAVKKSREHHREPPHSLKALTGFIEAAAGKAKREVQPIADPVKVAEFWEAQIAAGKRVSPSAIKPQIARLIVERGTVTAQQFKEMGIAC